MARFRVGDWVRVVSRGAYCGYWNKKNIGKIGMVEESSSYPWVNFGNGVQDSGSEECLELVADKEYKSETHPMIVNISIGAELTNITIGGKRFRLVAED